MDQSERICDVYRSPNKADLYLYVDRAEGFERVPEALLMQFGEPQLALSFVLTPERKLARENPLQVLENLASQGFHLQMPDLEKPLGC
ncbi:MAG: YcgL domain-containing protein [Gammaproteobacteria bacterium]|nr:YcgL domain-containing protein [Gammaproteobacteria bacterium]